MKLEYSGPAITSAWMAKREQIVSAEFYSRARRAEPGYAAVAAARSRSARSNLHKAISEAEERRKPRQNGAGQVNG